MWFLWKVILLLFPGDIWILTGLFTGNVQTLLDVHFYVTLVISYMFCAILITAHVYIMKWYDYHIYLFPIGINVFQQIPRYKDVLYEGVTQYILTIIIYTQRILTLIMFYIYTYNALLSGADRILLSIIIATLMFITTISCCTYTYDIYG